MTGLLNLQSLRGLPHTGEVPPGSMVREQERTIMITIGCRVSCKKL
jgi:hypothetical protein